MSGVDIAEFWIGLVPAGYTAEAVAMDHLHRGTVSPGSGALDNPFDEWIGVQMRAAICGMVCPGNAPAAARLAWTDGEVSHTSNGILGGVFNAILCARAFVVSDLRQLAEEAVAAIPAESEYGQVGAMRWKAAGRRRPGRMLGVLATAT